MEKNLLTNEINNCRFQNNSNTFLKPKKHKYNKKSQTNPNLINIFKILLFFDLFYLFLTAGNVLYKIQLSVNIPSINVDIPILNYNEATPPSSVIYNGVNIKTNLNDNITYQDNPAERIICIKASIEGIKKVDIILEWQESYINANNMFYNCINIEHMNSSDFQNIEISYANNMFYGCTGLTSINLKIKQF